jgi:hypothetical protein
MSLISTIEIKMSLQVSNKHNRETTEPTCGLCSINRFNRTYVSRIETIDIQMSLQVLHRDNKDPTEPTGLE